ncbi:MAG TPA: CpsD/CapB family tyrosine-protein kinase [Steroidobacteraceae bacterium]|nr:CpsD/CapB family tyrosine-protein kinase [Steroidobacteraceae bacterium]
MGLIEEALRKSAQQRKGAVRSNGAAAPARVARAAPPPDQSIPQYAAAPVDAELMQRNLILPMVDDMTVTRAYKILRTRVTHRLVANGWHSVGITGTTAGEGKTLTAVNLAIALAQDVNNWVFLVDLDLQRPQVGPYLGMRYEYGLTDYLTGQASLEQVVYDISHPRLAVVPNARSVENSSELLLSPRMGDFLHFLQTEPPRRIVVFDLPPLLASDDVLAFSPRVDSFLLVISQGQTARRTLSNAKEVLSEMNVMGVVLNRSTERNDSPYY